jgi:L-asparaginase
VAIVMSHAGVDGLLVDALLAVGVDGLVAAATGNGTLHQALCAALLRAEQAGVTVRVASRCVQGRMWPQENQSWADVQALSPVKARISLLLDLIGKRITVCGSMPQ